MTLTKCPPNLQNFGRETITVFVSRSFGTFTLELEGHCSCECEREQNTIVKSPSCTSNGNLTCGQCSCDEGWTGDDCSCSTAMCQLVDDLQCSGSERGQCVCASCECRRFESGQRYFGDNCECENNRCLSGMVECSNLGTCTCDNGCSCNTSSLTNRIHRGTLCQCNDDQCVSPNDPCMTDPAIACQLCSGFSGACVCTSTGSQCNCPAGFSGDQCQVDSEAVNECSGDIICVDCYAEAGEAGVAPSEVCPGLECPGYTRLTNNPDNYVIPNAINNTQRLCPRFDGTSCTYTYYQALSQDNDDQRLYHVLPRFCLPLPSWGIALIILFALLILGLLILICVKLIYVWLDYREVRRLRLEVQNTKFTTYQSPLYHDPNVTYTNVKYGKEE